MTPARISTPTHQTIKTKPLIACRVPQAPARSPCHVPQRRKAAISGRWAGHCVKVSSGAPPPMSSITSPAQIQATSSRVACVVPEWEGQNRVSNKEKQGTKMYEPLKKKVKARHSATPPPPHTTQTTSLSNHPNLPTSQPPNFPTGHPASFRRVSSRSGRRTPSFTPDPYSASMRSSAAFRSSTGSLFSAFRNSCAQRRVSIKTPCRKRGAVFEMRIQHNQSQEVYPVTMQVQYRKLIAAFVFDWDSPPTTLEIHSVKCGR